MRARRRPRPGQQGRPRQGEQRGRARGGRARAGAVARRRARATFHQTLFKSPFAFLFLLPPPLPFSPLGITLRLHYFWLIVHVK